MVQPVSRAGTSFCMVSDSGTFQGTTPATTPTGSREHERPAVARPAHRPERVGRGGVDVGVEDPDRVDDLDRARLGDGTAHLLGDDLGELLGVLDEEVAQPLEDRRCARRGVIAGHGAGAQRPAGGGHRAVDVLARSRPARRR